MGGDDSLLLKELEDLEVEAVENYLDNSKLRQRLTDQRNLNDEMEIRELEK